MVPPGFARPTIGSLERLIASRATPSPISPCLVSDAFDYYRVAELSSIVASGAVLRVKPELSYPTRRKVDNHESSRTFAPQIRAILAEEMAAGTTFLIGKTLPAEWLAPGSGLFVNPVGAVEKGSSTPEIPKVRIIVDASSGGEISINSRIAKSTLDEDDPHIQPYLSNQVIAATLLAAGPQGVFSLTDVKSAFNNVALDPSNYRFSVILFEGLYYCQTRLGFGYRSGPSSHAAPPSAISLPISRSAPDIFEVVMQSVDHIARSKHALRILRIVDDVLNVDTPDVAAHNADLLRALLAKYGLPVASEKNVNQQPSVKFNGLIWSAPSQTVTIPEPKVQDIRACIALALAQHPPPLDAIESITGKLQAVTCVVPDGKAHLQHLYRMMAASKLKSQPRGRAAKFIATRGTRAELSWWSNRLLHVVPRRMSALAAELLPATDAIVAFTDASGLGLGVFVPGTGLWAFMKVPARFAVNPAVHVDSVIAVGSTLIEVAAVVLAIMTFQDLWADRLVVVNCDNSGAVGVFTRRHSANELTGAMLTFAVDLCTSRNITLRLSWIPGTTNVVADPISRGNTAAFRAIAPSAAILPCPCTGSPFDVIS